MSATMSECPQFSNASMLALWIKYYREYTFSGDYRDLKSAFFNQANEAALIIFKT